MSKKYKFGLGIIVPVAAVLLVAFLLRNNNIAILNPKGTIASQQHDLIITITILMLIIVLPVFALTFGIAWRYRESNTKAKYSPDLGGNRAAETIWWTVPLIIITIISGIIWKSSHDLDPFKPVAASKKPLTIQVVALNWKWLFIYPDQNMATVNYVQFPVDTPVEFKLTSDAPMNSFWIPQLGGQIYAMAGMQTELSLMATEKGEYTGQSANLSGEGFAGMKFTAKASSDSDFNNWVITTKYGSENLNFDTYQKLAQPSKNNPPFYYASIEDDLYHTVISKYLSPDGSMGSMHHGH